MTENRTDVPFITDIDWSSAWRDLAKTRNVAPDSQHWDVRSKKYPRKHNNSDDGKSYVSTFINYLSLESGDSIFDMGCGNGALAIPLAKVGHNVIAADFSSGMLSVLNEEIENTPNLPIKTVQMSWTDDWASVGIEPKSVDVAIASRSICTDDIADSFARLDSVARKKCAVTLPLGTSPRIDPNILDTLGIPYRKGTAYEYAFMILVQMGRLPEVRYIKSVKPNIFANEQEAYDGIMRMVEDALDGEDTCKNNLSDKVKNWTNANLVAANASSINSIKDTFGSIGDLPKEIPDGAVMLKIPRIVTWVYLSWETAE